MLGCAFILALTNSYNLYLLNPSKCNERLSCVLSCTKDDYLFF